MTVSGGQLFSRRLFAGYQAVVAGLCLGSLGANPLLFGALALLHTAAAVGLIWWSAKPSQAGGSRFGALWPWVLWFLSWIEIGRFTAWMGQGTHDTSIIALDLAAAQATSSEGDLAGLAELLRHLGDSPGTAFPSSHCAGALTAALAAGRYLERPWPPVLVGWALLITVATVATGNHYAIDSVCGLIVALGVYLAFIRRLPRCAL